MAIDKTKLARLSALEALALRLKGVCGDKNVVETVKVNGAALSVTDRAVDITVPTQDDIQTAISTAVAAADHLKRRIVESVESIDLAAADAAQYIYMTPKGTGADGDQYDEYMVLNGALEKVGDWAVDLSGYVAAEEGKGLSANDYTDTDKAKLDSVEFASDEEVAAMLDEVFGETA